MMSSVLLLREMSVVAHQKQIEQLRESFRQEVSEAEKYPKQVYYIFIQQ